MTRNPPARVLNDSQQPASGTAHYQKSYAEPVDSM